jgi:hypothetical protein
MPRKEDLERAAERSDRRQNRAPEPVSAPALANATAVDGVPQTGGRPMAAETATTQHSAQHTAEDAAAVMTGFGIYLILARLFRRDTGE